MNRKDQSLFQSTRSKFLFRDLGMMFRDLELSVFGVRRPKCK